MPGQEEEASRFRALHQTGHAFVMPNAWDAGTALLLAGLGFAAIGTTSAGLALSLGVEAGTGAVSREETLANARAIVAATALPVFADLEDTFGDTPAACAEPSEPAFPCRLAGR